MTDTTDSLFEDFAKAYGLTAEDCLLLSGFIASGAADNYANYTHVPVGIQEFIESPEFLNSKGSVYPLIMDELRAMNDGTYTEVVLTGGIGSGKSTSALYTQAYQLYLLSCLKDPHKEFGLDPASEILIVFQNINAELAKEVDYKRFKTMIEGSPYFQAHFPCKQGLESRLVFPHRIEVVPISGLETAAIGQNVIGGIIDEVNFMANIEKSKQSDDGGGYDQATALYNSIARRRKSRFMKAGRNLPGLLCLVSSRRYPGQFTDKKEAEAKDQIARTGKTNIYIYDKRVWDVKPADTFSGDWFHVFIGDEFRKPRVMKEGEEPLDNERAYIDAIPMEFYDDFQDDIIKALRDIAGHSSMALHPFMPDREKVLQNFGKRQNLFDMDDTDFHTSSPGVHKAALKINRTRLRWCHLDLGLTSDSAGLVIGHVPEFVEIKRGDHAETLPRIEIDGILEVKPPVNGEIEFSRIRQTLYSLRDLGCPIVWVSLDSFQSADSMQILRAKGFTVGYQSIDKSLTPYELCKQALYDGRVTAPAHPKLQLELLQLERNFKTNKVDHHAHGSKDIADALTGVVFGLTTRREIWADHKVSFQQAISISSLIKEKDS